MSEKKQPQQPPKPIPPPKEQPLILLVIAVAEAFPLIGAAVFILNKDGNNNDQVACRMLQT